MSDKAVLFEIKYALSPKIHSHLSFRLEMNAYIWATFLVIKRKRKTIFLLYYLLNICRHWYICIDVHSNIHFYISVNPDTYTLCLLWHFVVSRNFPSLGAACVLSTVPCWLHRWLMLSCPQVSVLTCSFKSSYFWRGAQITWGMGGTWSQGLLLEYYWP